MYRVICKYCGEVYESKVNRSGICPDCKTRALVEKNNRYRDKNYDRITVYLPKGRKDEIREYLEEKQLNFSLNQLINIGLNMVYDGLIKDFGEPKDVQNEKDEKE